MTTEQFDALRDTIAGARRAATWTLIVILGIAIGIVTGLWIAG